MNWVGLPISDGYVQLPRQMSIWKGQGPPKRHLADVYEGVAVILSLAPKGYEDRLVHRFLTNPANDRVGKPHERIVEVDNLKNVWTELTHNSPPLYGGEGFDTANIFICASRTVYLYKSYFIVQQPQVQLHKSFPLAQVL